jgi:hypothetical protein
MRRSLRVFCMIFWTIASTVVSHSQEPLAEPGNSIGSISTIGNLIVFTLNEGVLGKANLFDLAGRSVRFTPDGAGYRVETRALNWDADFGGELNGGQVSLKNFVFPFSGKSWSSFSVGVTGSIAFTEAATGGSARGGGGARGGRGGGVTIGRFDELQEGARSLVNAQPAICVFMKPRTSGQRFVKELSDKVVVTWNLTEPYGGIQDFSWTPTVNRFQAVLGKDGAVEMSYQQMAARDAIVGLYPLVTGGTEKAIATVAGEEHPAVAPHLDIKDVKLAAVDGLFLKVTLELRGPALPESDPGLAGVAYHVYFDGHKPFPARAESAIATSVWTIRGGANRYIASGSGVSRTVKVDGNTISVEGVLPAGFKEGQQVTVYVDSATGAVPGIRAMQIPPKAVTLAGIRNPELHLSGLRKNDGPFPMVYESFHYLSLPRMWDLSCTVIKALGDKFDMLTYYSDFRVDNQEAGTPSDGPWGAAGITGLGTRQEGLAPGTFILPAQAEYLKGIGAAQAGLAGYCTQGRFQWEFIQPVYVGANQAQKYPPEGLTDTNIHNVVTYTRQIAERSHDGKLLPYDYAMAQIGHEMGHRWAAFVSAKVGSETIHLGDGTHWVAGLQARAPFPYQRPTEASAMGGGVWQDNFDGTFTQLDDNYFVPATGWSYLDLYLMGLIGPAEAPDFFILRNLVPAGRDTNGHPIFKADRTKVTINDVIAVEGPRLPDVDHSQKKFNTGMVVVVEQGKKPSPELLEQANGIRLRWMDYWETTTGHRSSMTTEVK